MSNWIIFPSREFEATVNDAFTALNMPAGTQIKAFCDNLAARGNRNPEKQKFIILLDRSRHGKVHSRLLPRSLDWAVYEAIDATARELVKIDDKPEYSSLARDHLLPELLQRLEQQAINLVRSPLEGIKDDLESTGLTRRDEASRRASLTEFKAVLTWPIEIETYAVVEELIHAATAIASRHGLNGSQLFAENTLHRIMSDEPAFKAFNKLPKPTQKMARSWFVAARGWSRFYNATNDYRDDQHE